MSDPDRRDGGTGDDPDPGPDRRSDVAREADDSDPPWRFALDDVDEDGIVAESIEPGRIDPENALFVLLGAAATVLVFVRLVLIVS